MRVLCSEQRAFKFSFHLREKAWKFWIFSGHGSADRTLVYMAALGSRPPWVVLGLRQGVAGGHVSHPRFACFIQASR